MKAISTISVIIFIGAAALAQNLESHESKIQHCKVGLLLDFCFVHTVGCEKSSQDINIARLYRRQNTRVRKALNFKTKYTRAKLA